MSPLQFLLALRARWTMFALVLVATVLTATVVSFVLPKTYVATASVLVDAKDEQSLNNTALPARSQAGYLQTQVDIITSRKVALKVVGDLKLAQGPEARRAFERGGNGSSIEDWLVTSLLQQLKVNTSQSSLLQSQSSVIQIGYSAADPRLAADIANGFAKAYIDTGLELRTEPLREAAAWFNEQMKELRANLEQAQAKLAAHEKKKGIIATDERYDIENARLAELSTQAVQAQSQTYDAMTRWQQARDLLANGASLDGLQVVQTNPLIQSIKTDLFRSEARAKELSTQLGPNHPQYLRQTAESQMLREKLRNEMNSVIRGLENAARQSQERGQGLRGASAGQRQRVIELRESRSEVAILTRDVESAQRAYDSALQRYVVNNVDSRARQTNISVLNPAVVPLSPARPRLRLNIALSLVAGAMLGLGIVYLAEMFDRRVRSRGDLVGELNVPLLVVINRWQGPGERQLPGPGSVGALPKPS